MHELLARDGLSLGYTTLRRFVHDELGWRERPVTVRVEDPPPADEAQIDFGEMGYVTDDEGHRRKLWVLIVTLSMSRYMFVWPTFAQTCAALIDGLEAAWHFLAGVTKRVVPDNMSSAVVRAHPTEPVLNRAFLEYAQWRGFFVDPARVRHPQDKPRVENQVAYVRERWFAGETFRADLVELFAPPPLDGATTSPVRACMAPRGESRATSMTPKHQDPPLPALRLRRLLHAQDGAPAERLVERPLFLARRDDPPGEGPGVRENSQRREPMFENRPRPI